MRLGVVHQALDERAEESAQVGMRDEQVERQLHRVALNRRHALGSLTVVAQGLERSGELCDLQVRAELFAKRGRLRRFG